MSLFQIPRQPTTRIELLPGVGLFEVGIALGGSAIGYLVAQAVAYIVKGDYHLFVILGFGVAGFFLVQGEQNSLLAILLRQRAYNRTSQRMLFRVGSGVEPKGATMSQQGQDPSATQPSLQSKPHRTRLRRSRKPESKLPKSVQTWLPVSNVSDDLIHRRDGRLVAVVRLEPVNLSLRSPSEQNRLLAVLHEAINALQQPAQILSIPRPIDLDHYVQSLRNHLLTADPARERLLRMYTQYVAGLVGGGEVQERRFFILLSQPPGREATREVLQRAHDLTARLRQADLAARVLDDQELFDLLYVWGHPEHAAFERPPVAPPGVTTLMEG